MFPDNNPPANVTFYKDEEGTQPIENVTKMKDLVDVDDESGEVVNVNVKAYRVENGASVDVIRCITSVWTDICDWSSGVIGAQCPIKDGWLSNNVRAEETFYKITDTTNDPAVFNVLVSDIYSAYEKAVFQDDSPTKLMSCVIGASGPWRPYWYHLTNKDWRTTNITSLKGPFIVTRTLN